jgi:hypothetical protein
MRGTMVKKEPAKLITHAGGRGSVRLKQQKTPSIIRSIDPNEPHWLPQKARGVTSALSKMIKTARIFSGRSQKSL